MIFFSRAGGVFGGEKVFVLEALGDAVEVVEADAVVVEGVRLVVDELFEGGLAQLAEVPTARVLGHLVRERVVRLELRVQLEAHVALAALERHELVVRRHVRRHLRPAAQLLRADPAHRPAPTPSDPRNHPRLQPHHPRRSVSPVLLRLQHTKITHTSINIHAHTFVYV
jgi:hypothetical protein